MKGKILLMMLAALGLFAALTSAQDVDQNINQDADQMAMARNNTTINQSINQSASQDAAVDDEEDADDEQYVNQGINQSAGQTATGGNVTQSINQIASQTTWNVENYWDLGAPEVEITSQQRTVLTSRVDYFLQSYPETRMFIMAPADVQTIIVDEPDRIILLDVSAAGIVVVPAGFNGIIRIPLVNLDERLDQIPTDVAVAVIGDNDMDSAVAMTILRMYGYNAWVVPVGVCGWQGVGTWSGVTGTAVISGMTTTTQTVDGVTTGQTTGGATAINY